MSEKFNLKWNDFHSSVSKLFTSLRNDDTFYDASMLEYSMMDCMFSRYIYPANGS